MEAKLYNNNFIRKIYNLFELGLAEESKIEGGMADLFYKFRWLAKVLMGDKLKNFGGRNSFF